MKITNIKAYTYNSYTRHYATANLDNGKRVEFVDLYHNNNRIYSMRQLFDAAGEWVKSTLWYGGRQRGCGFMSVNKRYQGDKDNGKVLDTTV